MSPLGIQPRVVDATVIGRRRRAELRRNAGQSSVVLADPRIDVRACCRVHRQHRRQHDPRVGLGGSHVRDPGPQRSLGRRHDAGVVLVDGGSRSRRPRARSTSGCWGLTSARPRRTIALICQPTSAKWSCRSSDRRTATRTCPDRRTARISSPTKSTGLPADGTPCTAGSASCSHRCDRARSSPRSTARAALRRRAPAGRDYRGERAHEGVDQRGEHDQRETCTVSRHWRLGNGDCQRPISQMSRFASTERSAEGGRSRDRTCDHLLVRSSALPLSYTPGDRGPGAGRGTDYGSTAVRAPTVPEMRPRPRLAGPGKEVTPLASRVTSGATTNRVPHRFSGFQANCRKNDVWID